MAKDQVNDMIIRGLDKVEEKVDHLNDKIDGINIGLSRHLAEDDVVQKNIDNQLNRMNTTLEVNTQSLQEHMLRTSQNEEMIKRLADLHEVNDSRIEKLEVPHIMFSSWKSWFVAIGTIAGAIAGILKLFKVY